jgi:F5/8 type C domain
LNDGLRLAIDGLVKDGGRLTVDAAADGVSVLLEQPGSRFGILEVNGRVVLPSADARAGTYMAAMGWTDPTVTHRLGREIRLPRAHGAAEGPTVFTRTWRVPPSLAAEISDAVRAVLGEVGRVDFLPLRTREGTAVGAAQPPRPPTEELDIDRPDERRAAGRTVPAPFKGILAVTLMGVVALVWAGMIRGAPRIATPTTGSSPAAISAGAPVTPSPTPLASASPHAEPSAPLRSLVVNASTENDSGPAAAAVDGDPVTAWHAAFGVPQWIEIGLDAPSTVKEVVLLIAQAEKGATRHMIQVAVTGQAFEVVGVVDRQTADGDAIVFRPETPIENVERIRIETMASPSNAGWYEVIVR